MHFSKGKELYMLLYCCWCQCCSAFKMILFRSWTRSDSWRVLKQVLLKAAVHVNFNELFIKVQTHKSVASLPELLPILKTQLPYFITYAEPLKAPINPDYIIIISSLTDRLIYSATVIFIWYVTTRCTLGKNSLKTRFQLFTGIHFHLEF